MEDNTLTQEFDLLILGTGQAESTVAAAASRVGKKVLHVDVADYYGGSYATLSLRQLESLAFPGPKPFDTSHSEGTAEGTAEKLALKNIGACSGMQAVASVLHARDNGLVFFEEPDRIPESLAKIASRFNVDLVPSLVIASGKTVDALRCSGASSYAEFKSLESAWVVDESQNDSGNADSSNVAHPSPWIFNKVGDEPEVSV